MVKTSVSSKGQTTIPSKFRARWKTREVVWEEADDGSAIVKPVPDIMALRGSAGNENSRDIDEKAKAREAWAGAAAQKGRRA